MRPLLATALLLSAASCGGPLFSAEVEIDRFCFTAPSPVSVPFVAGPLPTGSPLTTGPIDVPVKLPPLLRTKGTLEVKVEELRLTARAPAGTDLSGVTLLEVAGPAGLIASYARPSPAPPAPLATIVATGTDFDIAAAARAGTLSVTVRADGSPPVGPPGQSWTADIELCAHGRSVIPYF